MDVILRKVINIQLKVSEDYSTYDNHRGPIPAIEMEKYNLTMEAGRLIENGDFLAAARIKRQLAAICREQGRERDAYLMEVTAGELIANVESNLNKEVAAAEKIEDYLTAANLKEKLAAICREQGKERDAFLLETTAAQYRIKVAETKKTGGPYF